MHTLLSAFLSLLPERYRKRWKWISVDSAGTCLSGVVELVFCFALLLGRFIAFANQKTQESLPLFSGALLYLIYLTQPLSMVLIYFAIEGGIRALAAGIANQVLCSMPLKVVALIQGRLEQAAHEKKLGNLVPDEVKPGPDGYDLIVESCRPKPDWRYHLNTVSYQEGFYEVVTERTGVSPRRFVYLLRKLPANKMVRGIHPYDPNEVMIPMPGKWQAFKHVISRVFHQMTNDFRQRREKL